MPIKRTSRFIENISKYDIDEEVYAEVLSCFTGEILMQYLSDYHRKPFKRNLPTKRKLIDDILTVRPCERETPEDFDIDGTIDFISYEVYRFINEKRETYCRLVLNKLSLRVLKRFLDDFNVWYQDGGHVKKYYIDLAMTLKYRLPLVIRLVIITNSVYIS